MSYSRNMPDWQQYNALQSGGSEASKSGQNVNSSHHYVPNISPSSMNGLNLSTDCLSKSQNDVINYSQRNYQPPNNTPSGPNNLVEPPLTSIVHMSNCVGHYGASSSMNSMMDDSSNVDHRNGSVATLNEEMAHRNQISLNGPVSRVIGSNMNASNNMGTTGPRIPPTNNVPSSRQGPYMSSCKGPCCVSDPNVNYQTWEKFTSYPGSNPYRENMRASGYAAESRRYRNEMTYRKDSYTNKDLIPPNSYHVDQRRNFSDYKYCKETSVPRNYQPSTVLPNYPLPNYSVPNDYQKYAYSMKDYQRQGIINTQNPGILKYPDHNINMQEKYSPKQNQYQSGALLQKGLVVPSISTNISSVQNPYLNPQFSREFQWDNVEKDTNKIQNPVPMHSAYPKYQLYQQKYAMQRFSMENHLRELSRIPGYQTHPKYQECILRYRELLRLQQTVDYQSAIQNTLTSTNNSIPPPINLQFDQNGVLINSNYLSGNFPTSHNSINPIPHPVNLEKEQHVSSEKIQDLQRLQNLPMRSQQEGQPVPNPENIPREVQYLNNQKTIENPHCQVVRREEERFEGLNPREVEHKNSKNFSAKPALDVRQFLENWDEAEEEEGANANLPDVVLSNSTPIVVVEYGNVGLVAPGSENTADLKTDNEVSMKAQEYYQKDQANADLLQECSNELNQGVVYANKLNIKCVGEGIDGVPTIHIVENLEGEYAYNEKGEMEVSVGALPSLSETKECETSESKEVSTSLNYKKLTHRNSDSKLQINPQDLSILPLAKNGPDSGTSNLKKQNSFTNEENHNSDDISLPDLTTSECTPISTTLNTPTHSDSEECSDRGVDLTTSTNPIELIQNSPMISFTQSPVKMDPYEHLKGENLSRKSSHDGLDFDFQGTTDSVIKLQVSDHKKESEKIVSTLENSNPTSEEQNSSSKYSQMHTINQMIPENSPNKESSAFSSNLDVFSSEDQDKWCWNSIPLIPGEENEEPKIPAPPMEENDLTKIIKDSAPITSLNVLESDEEKTNKVDDMWLEGYMEKSLDLSSEAKTSSNEKLYSDVEHKIQKKKDFAEVSASVSKILKNIKERQNFIQNSMQDSKNTRRNPKGINIISEEIFNSTWRRNTQNKMYPPFRKMSDSFEREEIEAFAENYKNSDRSRSRSLEIKAIRNRSKSVENLRINDTEEERLFTEFRNLKRKRSTDHFPGENKLPKLSFEQDKEQANKITAKQIFPVENTDTCRNPHTQKNDVDQENTQSNENRKKVDSDLEIKFRNSCDSSKPFEAIKIEINVSRSDSKTVNQSLSQPQKCNEPDNKGNREDPSRCGFATCSGRNSNCQSSSMIDTKVQNQKSCDDLDAVNSEKMAEKSRIQREERKESVIEYLGKSQNPKISKLGYSSCDTCKSLSFQDLDKEYICTHLDNRKSKQRESIDCLKNSLEAGNSKIECLSNRIKCINKTKSLEDFNRKSKLEELKHFRKLKLKDNDCFSGYENIDHRIDKMDVSESLEILPGTSEFSGFRSAHANDLLKDNLGNTSDDAKNFVIKNSLNCDSSSYDEMPYKAPENNFQDLSSNLLDENSLSPKGYFNPLFNSLEEVENLNTVPVYTTKDGKITYSPNPRFTYKTLLMEAREKESRSHFEKSLIYSSTPQEKRSSKSSEKRSLSSKYQTDLKPPKKSLAKRFATQELEKSYQRYLSHKENKKCSLTNEPMVIKTIKNYNVLNESTSGNEAQDEKQHSESNTDFDEIQSQIEHEINRNCREWNSIEENAKDSDEASKLMETCLENQIDKSENPVFTEIQSPSPGDTEDNQVVPVASSDKSSVMEIDNLTQNDSTSVSITTEHLQDHSETAENSLGIIEVEEIQHCNADFNLFNSVSKLESNFEKKIDIQDSKKEQSMNSEMQLVPLFKLNYLPVRRKSTSHIELQSTKLISVRRKSESNVSSSLGMNSRFLENSKISRNEKSSKNLKNCVIENLENVVNSENLETAENMEICQNTDISKNCDNIKISENIKNVEYIKISKDIEVPKNTTILKTTEMTENTISNNTGILENTKIWENVEISENTNTLNSNEILENIRKPNSPEKIEINQSSSDLNSIPSSQDCTNQKEKKIETINEEIPVIEIEDEEEREFVCSTTEESAFLFPPRKDIEIIEIEDDEILGIEPKQEIYQNSVIDNYLDESEEIDSEKRIEINVDELKLPVKDQIEDELVTLQSDLESKSEISNIITQEDEIQIINIDETPLNNKTINSVTENLQKDISISIQENHNEHVQETLEELGIPRNKNNYHSNFEQEVNIISESTDKQSNEDFIGNQALNISREDHCNKPMNKEINQESNEKYEADKEDNNSINHNYNQQTELNNCEREFLETRGLSLSPVIDTPTETFSDKNSERTKDIIKENSNEGCSMKENEILAEQSFDFPLISNKNNEKGDTDSIYIDDDSCFEIDPPTLEIQKEISDSEILNSPKSSNNNHYDRMPNVSLENSFRRESHLKNDGVEKMVPKLVIRKIETNRSSPIKSKSSDAIMEPSFYRKIPKMIIRNAKSRPATPTIEEIPEKLSLSTEDSNVIKVKIRLDDINKSDSYIFSNEESRIPKMKIKLEDKLPKVVIENLDIRNSQDIQKLVPKVKIKKLKNIHSIDDNVITNNSEGSDSHFESTEQTYTNSEPLEKISDSSSVESEENRNKIPKLKIKKDLKITSSNSRKRHSNDVIPIENKKVKRSSKEEAKQERRMDPNLENSMSSSDYNSEKVPKVIIKRTSPTAQFKCEVSNDKKNTSLQDPSLQPQVVLQRSWILDCMAKELRHVNIALKLAIAKNGTKASVRGKSDSSKIQWEQFIRSLKKQKELSKSESGPDIFSNKVKQRRKSDVGLRYFESNSKMYKIKACKSAREATNCDANYSDNRSLYFKDMFSNERIRNNQNMLETWKKYDENMNSESKNILQAPEKTNFTNHFSDHIEASDASQREVKLNEDVETKCPLLNAEEVDSKPNLVPDLGATFESIGENEINIIKTEEENQSVSGVRPELSTSLIANGEHEYLYSEDAIPTQFEFELEIVDSSVDTYDIPMADIKELPESNDAVELQIHDNRLEVESANDFDQFPRLHLPDENSSLVYTGQDSSCDIKDEIPVLNNLLNSADTSQNFNLSASSSNKFSDSISLVQEVMAAKEMLRKYLPKYENESTSSKSRPRTLAEKKQGTRFSLTNSERISSIAKETSEHFSSRSHTRYDKKRPKESSRSREKHKSRKSLKLDDESCKYDQHNTISLRDQKRSSLHPTQSEELNKPKDKDSGSRSKSSDSNSKNSGNRSDSRSQKSRESSKDNDRNKMKSYKIPKLSKSKENNGEDASEFKAKGEMPILVPEGGMNLDPSSDRDASLSPPVITNQEDVEIFEEDSKIFDTHIGKEDRVSCKTSKTMQVDPGGTLADAVQKWVFHEKATIKHRRYCVLCERWFPSVIRHRRHLSGYQHRHTELTQRRTIHTLFMLFTGNPCPRLLPADILRSDCSLGEPTPLQIAVQNVALDYGEAHEKIKMKDEENKQ